jgi:hypothetical protein
MKTSTMHLLLATATMMVASTAASAQSALKAEIPFRFRVAGVAMEPGVYEVIPTNAESHFLVRAVNHRAAVFVSPTIKENVPREWQKGRTGMMEFTCGAEACDLLRIWSGIPGNYARGFMTPKQEGEKVRGLAAIRLVPGLVK